MTSSAARMTGRLRIEVSNETGLLRDRFVQQADVDNVLLVPVTPMLPVMPMLPVTPLLPVTPKLPVTPVLFMPAVEPVVVVPQLPRPEDTPEITGTTTVGLVTGSTIWGVAKAVVGLTPKLPISRDPNGIPTGVPIALDDDPVTVDGVAVKLKDDDAVVQFMPPPLKLERGEVTPATPELDAMVVGARTLIQPVLPTLPEELIVPRDWGVSMPDVVAVGVDKPPGFISRAPKGIPVGPTGFGSEPIVGEPSVERGEVAPIAGVVAGMTCAKLGPLDNSADTIMAVNQPLVVSLCSFRI
jgi:hypothetical protein